MYSIQFISVYAKIKSRSKSKLQNELYSNIIKLSCMHFAHFCFENSDMFWMNFDGVAAAFLGQGKTFKIKIN